MSTSTSTNIEMQHFLPAKKKSRFVEFKLDESFIDKFRGRQPNWKNDMAYFVYKRTYARMVSERDSKGNLIYQIQIGKNKIDERAEYVYFNINQENGTVTTYKKKEKKNADEDDELEIHEIGIKFEEFINRKDCIGEKYENKFVSDATLRSEEFWETLRRVVEGEFKIIKTRCIEKQFPWYEEKGQDYAQKSYELMWNFKFLPPGRGLWSMGTDFVESRGTVSLNNCGFVSTKNIATELSKPFGWCMDALMLGVGVGFDTKGAEKITIKKPKSFSEIDKDDIKMYKKLLSTLIGIDIPKWENGDYIKSIASPDDIKIFTIPDSREGWVVALRLVLDAYFMGTYLPQFDVTEIRPEGTPIRGFGGVASGPKPLTDMLDFISRILEERIGKKLESVDIVDIFNQIANCVVSGNVRRSAEIALGDINDSDYINMKSPTALQEISEKSPHRDARWASNNSVIAYVGSDYSKIAEKIAQNGEPGIFWIENAKHYFRMREDEHKEKADDKVEGVNPCCEQSLETYELCCLCETFPSHHESYEEYENTLKFAYIYGKAVTLSFVNDPRWSETNKVMTANRRIGVSQSGITDAFAKHGRQAMMEWCKKGYEYLRARDHQYSEEWLMVRESKKITTVKPSGCSVKETMINTSEGIFRLEEMGDIHGDQWQESHHTKTTFGKDISKFYVNGIKQTKKIITDDGVILESTLNHKYRVYNGDITAFHPDKIIWKEVRDLTENDHLVCILDDYHKITESKLEIINFESHTNNVMIKQPEYMSEKLAWLIGHIFANGSVHEKGIRIHFNRVQDSLVRFIIECVKDLFGIDAKLDGEHSLYINSIQVLKYLEHNGLLKSYSHDIAVPLKIRTASRKSIHAFINGFWRGDGGQHKPNTWTMCTTSEKFAQELVVLCRAIGINVKLNNAGCGGWGSRDRWIIQSRLEDKAKLRYVSSEVRDRYHLINDIYYWLDPIIALKDSENETFDISVPDTNQYIANGVISHNTLSQIAGVSDGIHYPHSEYYIRRVRISKNDPSFDDIKDCGYQIDPDYKYWKRDANGKPIKNADGTYAIKNRRECVNGEWIETNELADVKTYVVEFPIYIANFKRSKYEVSAWEQLANVYDYQRNWSDNQVSATITFTKDEARDIKNMLECYEDKLKGISFLPIDEHGYDQAPYEKISKEKYEEIISKIKITLYAKKMRSAKGKGVTGCDGNCEIKYTEVCQDETPVISIQKKHIM